MRNEIEDQVVRLLGTGEVLASVVDHLVGAERPHERRACSALSTPVTCAPSRLASWIANEPEPPPAPLISTRRPAAAPSVPCSAIAPACGIVEASANVSAAGLWASAGLRRDRVLGEAALEREVVAVHLVAGPEPGDTLADGLHRSGDVRSERAAGR